MLPLLLLLILQQAVQSACHEVAVGEQVDAHGVAEGVAVASGEEYFEACMAFLPVAYAALELVAYAAHHAGAYGGGGVVAHVGRVAVGLDAWQACGACVEGFEAHLHARRYVAAEVVAVGGDEVVGDAGAGVDDQQVGVGL